MTGAIAASTMAVLGIAALAIHHGYRWRAEQETKRQARRVLRQAQLDRAAEHTVPRDIDAAYARTLASAGSLDAEPPYDQAAMAAAMDVAYGRDRGAA